MLSKTVNIPKILMCFLTFIWFISCSNEKAQPLNLSIENIKLNQYQRSVLCPNLFRVHRDIYDNAIQFNFNKYRIPFIKVGTITIEEESNQEYRILKTLYFKDSLLIKIKEGWRGTTELVYDNDKKLIKYGNIDYRYKNDDLIQIETEVTFHTLKREGNCIHLEGKDKNSTYTTNSLICYNERNNIIKDRLSYKLDERNIIEEHITNYDVDTIISKTYIEIENEKTTRHMIISNKRNSSGLLKILTTKLVNQQITYEEEYDYKVVSTEPLIVIKIKLIDGLKKSETKFTFNDKDQLIEYEQMGKYGDKYRILYSEK
jgi:hypothetical protein